MVTARIPELKDCGCGVPLAVGTKIIAILFSIVATAGFILALFFIIKCEIDQNNPGETAQQIYKETWKEVVAAMIMIICTFEGALAFCLLYGVKEHNPSFVLPWAILTTAFTVIFTFFELLLMLHKFSIVTVLLAIGIVIMFYFILIVYSYFRELRREKNLPQSLNDGEAA